MSHFRKQILTERGSKHLFFYSFLSRTGLDYHVSVACKNELPAVYRLTNAKGRWQLEKPDQCPGWLVGMEEELNEAIAEQG